MIRVTSSNSFDDACISCASAKRAYNWEYRRRKTKKPSDREWLDTIQNPPKFEARGVKKPISTDRGKIFEKARKTINGDRQDSYGSPEDSFSTIGEFWSTYLGVKISARQATEMMMLFKIARMKGQKPLIDNYVDCAGYTGIAADMLDDELRGNVDGTK